MLYSPVLAVFPETWTTKIEFHAASSVVTMCCHTGIAVVGSSRRFVPKHVIQDPAPAVQTSLLCKSV